MGKASKSNSMVSVPIAAPEDDMREPKNPKYPPTKSHPKGINPAYPNRNFVKMSYTNKGKDVSRAEMQFYDYMYEGPHGNMPNSQKAHNVHGHTGAQKVGRLRYSGHPGAHRVGKRGK